jgi:hypothetical protein
MTHNGKIARLPRNIRDELNHRLENGETSGMILPWLNALPTVQAVLAAEFQASLINGQNLSNWRKGGYQDWLKQQERRNLVRELTANAKELASEADGVEIGNHLSAMLVAELAVSARGALEELAEPAERCVRLQEFLLTLARVRRQDYLAGRLAIERERRTRERVKEEEDDEHRNEWEPMRLFFKRSNMTNLYASPDITSQVMANQEAESLLRDQKLNGSHLSGSTAPVNPKSN